MHTQRINELATKLHQGTELTRDEQHEILNGLIGTNAIMLSALRQQATILEKAQLVSSALAVCLRRLGGDVLIGKDESNDLVGYGVEAHRHEGSGDIHVRVVSSATMPAVDDFGQVAGIPAKEAH